MPLFALPYLPLKGATSQVAGSPAVLHRTVIVLHRTVIVLDRTVIVHDRTVIVHDRTVIVLDRTVITIFGIFSFLLLGGGSDRLWLLGTTRHTSTPALPSLSCLSGDRYVYKTLPALVCFLGGPGVAALSRHHGRCQTTRPATAPTAGKQGHQQPPLPVNNST